VVGGIVALSMNWQEVKKRKISFSSSEVVPALLIALGWGLYFFFLSPITRQSGWFFTTLLVRVFITLTLFVFLFPQLKKKTVTFHKIPWKVLLFAAALDVLAFTSFNLALSKYEVSYVSVVTSASPLITVILAAVFLKEKTDFVQKIGIAIVIFGIVGLQLASM
jgi:drug/metabolite transporter (DMT)-like permease